MKDNNKQEIPVPILKKDNLDLVAKEPYLVASVCLNNNEYYLYSNGKLYKNNEDGERIELNSSTEEEKKLIKEIMNMFKGGKTDIYIK